MSAMLEMVPDNVTPAELAPVIDAACGRIAPAWPLDRMIAVNPYWGFVDRPIEAAAAELSAEWEGRMLDLLEEEAPVSILYSINEIIGKKSRVNYTQYPLYYMDLRPDVFSFT